MLAGVLLVMLALACLADRLDAAVTLTISIEPRPPERDGAVLVVAAPPYLEQRCTVAANRCIVSLVVSADFARSGAVTIRSSSEKLAGSALYLTHVSVSEPPKQQAKRRIVRH